MIGDSVEECIEAGDRTVEVVEDVDDRRGVVLPQALDERSK
jgi:hypothetical protein